MHITIVGHPGELKAAYDHLSTVLTWDGITSDQITLDTNLLHLDNVQLHPPGVVMARALAWRIRTPDIRTPETPSGNPVATPGHPETPADPVEATDEATRGQDDTPRPGRWAGTEPQESEPHLDDLTRDQLAELAHRPELLAVHDTLFQWAEESDGQHRVGTFLELLADRGFRVTNQKTIDALRAEFDRYRREAVEFVQAADKIEAERNALRAELAALKTSPQLVWLPEFGADEEIPLGEPTVHNHADGRFVLRAGQPVTEAATEQSAAPATPTEPRVWRKGDPEPPESIAVLVDRKDNHLPYLCRIPGSPQWWQWFARPADRHRAPGGVPWGDATAVLGGGPKDYLIALLEMTEPFGNAPASPENCHVCGARVDYQMLDVSRSSREFVRGLGQCSADPSHDYSGPEDGECGTCGSSVKFRDSGVAYCIGNITHDVFPALWSIGDGPNRTDHVAGES